jgi:ribosomal-protein-alanine N-acetyltransferase
MSSSTKLADIKWRPPTLRSQRLILRGYEARDTEEVFRYASDPEVTPFMAWSRHRSLEDTQQFLDHFVARHYQNRELDYALCLHEAPLSVIGGLGVYWRSKEHRVMELGYVLSKQYWGQGLMPEACGRLLRYAFETTPVHRIYAPILSPNNKSRRAAEKMGLTCEGVHRSALALHGRRWDEVIYAVVRGELDQNA